MLVLSHLLMSITPYSSTCQAVKTFNGKQVSAEVVRTR